MSLWEAEKTRYPTALRKKKRQN